MRLGRLLHWPPQSSSRPPSPRVSPTPPPGRRCRAALPPRPPPRQPSSSPASPTSGRSPTSAARPARPPGSPNSAAPSIKTGSSTSPASIPREAAAASPRSSPPPSPPSASAPGPSGTRSPRTRRQGARGPVRRPARRSRRRRPLDRLHALRRPPDTTEHFRLVLGYDAETDEVIYHEPAEADGAYRRMPRDVLPAPLAAQVRGRPLARHPPAPRARHAERSAAHRPRHHRRRLRPALHARSRRSCRPGFTVVVTPPFVVIGDESPATVARACRGHGQLGRRPPQGRLLRNGPGRDPRHLALQGQGELREARPSALRPQARHALRLLLAHRKALVMNIATGGGTLVHEIVHPFMAANFPDCPAWFNEGLGSLYEQSGEQTGRSSATPTGGWPACRRPSATGVSPRSRRSGRPPTTSSTSDDRGTNYAQARYLCYYLQEHGLLEKFYHRFRAAAASRSRRLRDASRPARPD